MMDSDVAFTTDYSALCVWKSYCHAGCLPPALCVLCYLTGSCLLSGS
jgi:hypothetical protein